MSDVAISVENLSKQYRIGIGGTEQGAGYKTLRETLEGSFSAPFRAIAGVLHPGNGTAKLERQNTEYIWALKDVSLQVKLGEVLGIIGPNGAGKSTLLKILSRITEPTEGRAEINGRVGSLLEVGTGFHPELTGRENIYLNGAIIGMKRTEIKRKFDEIVEFAGVSKFIDTPVKRYSSGMYLRLAFSVAAHLDPEILLVDEVLAVGDAAFQKKCLGKMKDVTEAGRTILFVSHNMGAIEALCGKAIWLDAGAIKGTGIARRVVSDYSLDSNAAGFALNNANVRRTNEKFVIEKVLLKNREGLAKTIFAPGEDITVEVQFYASEQIEKPHLWMGISSQYGPLFGADMTVDGHCPEYLEQGSGKLECAFKMPILGPQTFTVRMGGREKDGVTFLTKTAEVAAFRIEASTADYGLNGPQAGISLMDGSPLAVPYEWRLPDGQVIEVKFEGCIR